MNINVRLWLRSILMAGPLAVVLAIPHGHAQQPGLPGGPGANPAMPGMPGRPGMPGMPGRPGGFPNMPGAPGMPNMPGGAFPGAPGMPGMPRPGFPSAPGMPGAGVPGGPGLGGGFQKVFICSNCRAELGRGMTKPNLATCPYCGIRFDNTAPGGSGDMDDRLGGAGGWNRGGGPTGPGPLMRGKPGARPGNPNMPGAPGFVPNAPPQILEPDPGFTGIPDTPADPNDVPENSPATRNSHQSFNNTPPSRSLSSPQPASAAPSSKTNWRAVVWIVVGLAGVLILFAIVGCAVWLFSTAPASSRRRPRRRSRRYDDDY